MTTQNMYVSLWESNGNEASFPGYTRLPVMFDITGGVARNIASIVWSVLGGFTQHITKMKVHRYIHEEAVFECSLDSPLSGGLRHGDTITVQSNGGVRITMDGDVSLGAWLQATGSIMDCDFDNFMEKYPNATHRDLWEAAFVAGHQTAHTLLTGDAE
jgi:hypothetical protein